MNLSYAIKHYRKKVFPARGGQAEFAAALGTTRQEVSAWENGKREPTLKNLRKIAKVLNISLDELISYKPSASSLVEHDVVYWRDLAILYKATIDSLSSEIKVLKAKIEEYEQPK